MRLGLLSTMLMAGLLSIPVPHQADAAPVTTAAPRANSAITGNSLEKAYYYRGRSYPYHYRHGYFRHRYYRHGRWHYY